MNYRELYNFQQKTKKDLTEIIDKYNKEIESYKKALSIENVNKKIEMTMFFEKLGFDRKNNNTIEIAMRKIEEYIPGSLVSSFDFINNKKMLLGNVENELEILNKKFSIDDLNKKEKKLNESQQINEISFSFESNMLERDSYLRENIKELIKENVDVDYLKKIKNAGFFKRLFNFIPKEFVNNLNSLDELIKDSRYEEINSLTVFNYKEINNFLDEKNKNLLEIKEKIKKIKSERVDIVNNLLKFDKLKKEKKDVSVDNYIFDLKSKIIEELVDKNKLNALINDFNMFQLKDINEINKRIDVISDFVNTLERKRENVNNQLNEISKNEYNLEKANKKVPSRYVKNFDEEKFKKSINDFKKTNNDAINWSSNRRKNILNDNINDNTMLFWAYILLLDNREDELNSGIFLMDDKLDVIRDLDLNEIKELESLKEIGCIDFETSNFNFGTDVSLPDFSSGFSDISSGFSGSSSSFGGDF